MGWLQDIARSLGLMVHNIKNPDNAKGIEKKTDKRVINKEVEEEHRGNVTLRRTTIEEIEIREGDASGNDDDDNFNEKTT